LKKKEKINGYKKSNKKKKDNKTLSQESEKRQKKLDKGQ
jgi:hypothetical protein